MNDRMDKEAGPALESLLSGLNRDQLQSLLLQRVMQGTITEQGVWDGEAPYSDKENCFIPH